MSATIAQTAAVTVDTMLAEGWTRAGDYAGTSSTFLEVASHRAPAARHVIWAADVAQCPEEDLVRPVTWRAPRLSAAQLWAEVQEVQGNARTRLLTAGDVEWFVGAVKRCLAYARRHGLDPLSIEVRTHGGFVPNSYRYRAECTWLRLDNGKITVSRTWAQSRAGGRGDTEVAKVRDPGHKSTGRCRKAGGYAFPTTPRS